MKENYQETMEKEIAALGDRKPTLLLQCCCAPCSSAVLERLARHFKLKLYYYNPNIYPEKEYKKRAEQFSKLLACPEFNSDIEMIPAPYEPERFEAAAKGLEDEKEGGKRCEQCFKLRLFETARKAKETGADYFCTTLTVSPHKNADILNAVGIEAEKEYGVKFLRSDFKKKEGYKRSTELSNELGLYRQNYCGCKYSIWF